MSAAQSIDLASQPGEVLAMRALAQCRTVLPLLRTEVIPMLDQPARSQAVALAQSIDRQAVFNAGFQHDLSDLTGMLKDEMKSQLVIETMWSDHDGDVTGSTWSETFWTAETVALAQICGELARLRDLVDAAIDRRNLSNLLSVGVQTPENGTSSKR